MIKGTRIDLRLITEKDIELLRVWRNSHSRDFFTKDYLSPQQQRAWYNKYAENSMDKMFIVQLKDSTPIGTIALYNINIADRTADLGRTLLLEDYRGQGYMEEAIKLLVNIAFDSMRLWNIRLSVYLDNAAAISLYHKAGFQSSSRPVLLMEATNSDKSPSKPVTMLDFSEND